MCHRHSQQNDLGYRLDQHELPEQTNTRYLCQCVDLTHPSDPQCKEDVIEGTPYCQRHQRCQKKSDTILPTSSHRALSWGLHILKTAALFGYKGLLNYTMGHDSLIYQVLPHQIRSGDLDSEDIAPMVTICFNVAAYFQWWLGDDPSTLTKSEMVDIKNDSELMTLSDGVYYLDFEGRESHYFVWLIQDNWVYYGGGYGGVKKFNVVQFDKKTYFDAFVKAMNGDILSYRFVFCLRPSDVVIPEVNYEYLKIQKSMRYV